MDLTVGGRQSGNLLGEIGISISSGSRRSSVVLKKEFQILLDIGHNLFLKGGHLGMEFLPGRVTINSQLIHHRVEHIRQCGHHGSFR